MTKKEKKSQEIVTAEVQQQDFNCKWIVLFYSFRSDTFFLVSKSCMVLSIFFSHATRLSFFFYLCKMLEVWSYSVVCLIYSRLKLRGFSIQLPNRIYSISNFQTQPDSSWLKMKWPPLKITSTSIFLLTSLVCSWTNLDNHLFLSSIFLPSLVFFSVKKKSQTLVGWLPAPRGLFNWELCD